MQTPLIVRVLMSADWSEAFRLVWSETFNVVADDMGLTAPSVDIVMTRLSDWPERRAICLRYARRCADDRGLPELAPAWTALGVDPAWPLEDPAPERAKMFLPVNRALGDAIVNDNALLNDSAFARTVLGWRFMEAFGIGGPDHDPIVIGRAVGAGFDLDKSELLTWARAWARGGSGST